MSLNTGTPKNINFSFGTNGKLMVLGVPILKHFRVCHFRKQGKVILDLPMCKNGRKTAVCPYIYMYLKMQILYNEMAHTADYSRVYTVNQDIYYSSVLKLT